jgi:NAD(P)-dependent dehydrogenase (short-subunit alcohol dehydrogenase family)
MRLRDKRAVITGGSDGIGLGIANAFVACGAEVLLIARDMEKLESARFRLLAFGDGKVHCLSADLSDPQAVFEIAGNILEMWPEIDTLVNNAGAAVFSPFEKVSLDELDFHLKLNVKAPYLLTQYLMPALERQRGCVINISSYFSHRMIPGRTSTAYSLTKGAIDSFTKALACEVGSRGVRVNAIAPGTVDTLLVRTALSRMEPDARKKFQDSIETIYPLGRIGSPEDIGGAAVYLASDEANWVTGNIFNIDGGLTTN